MNTCAGYTLALNSEQTYNWAHRPGNVWPCSDLSGKDLLVTVDANGLCDLMIDGRDDEGCDPTELEAIVTDHLQPEYRCFWPTWE